MTMQHAAALIMPPSFTAAIITELHCRRDIDRYFIPLSRRHRVFTAPLVITRARDIRQTIRVLIDLIRVNNDRRK